MAIKVWGVTHGPTAVEDLPEDEFYPEESSHFLVCKTEVDGEIEHMHFWFENFDNAYELKKHFDKSIEPLEVEFVNGEEP